MSTDTATGAERLVYAVKNKIIEDGWIQGTEGGWTTHGPVCLRGGWVAVVDREGDSYILHTPDEEERARRAVMAEIQNLPTSERRWSMTGFNDQIGRTKEQVVELLARAAQRAADRSFLA